MNITPTTIHKANSMPTKIVVYDTVQKKPVLLFSSVNLCVRYLFSHLLLKTCTVSKFHYLVTKCCQKKLIETDNIFQAPLTYRLIVSGELLEKLGDNDYVVLDERYRNQDFEERREVIDARKKGWQPGLKEYGLERVLAKGDLVALLYGRKKGYTAEIIEVKDKLNNLSDGKKYYTLQIDGINHDFKANVLELIEKREFLPEEDYK